MGLAALVPFCRRVATTPPVPPPAAAAPVPLITAWWYSSAIPESLLNVDELEPPDATEDSPPEWCESSDCVEPVPDNRSLVRATTLTESRSSSSSDSVSELTARWFSSCSQSELANLKLFNFDKTYYINHFPSYCG